MFEVRRFVHSKIRKTERVDTVKRDLLLRGVENFLSRAIVHIGKGQLIDEYDGRYRSMSIEKADLILRFALWEVEAERRKA